MGLKKEFLYDISHIDLATVKTKSDLLRLLHKHDSASFKFCINTGLINVAISKCTGNIDDQELSTLFECGLFHDTGKIGMSYEFLNYAGSYSIPMYNEMKKHTFGGSELLVAVDAEQEIIETALYHHCNFDGTGYPGNLFEKEIPLAARITRISDSVDAYLSKRCYKDGGPTNGVLDDLYQFNETSYDPALLDAFAAVHRHVMKDCHQMGIDQPSYDLYMLKLKELFASEYDRRELQLF